MQRYRVGFDIGGTFTDFVLCDTQTGALHTYKTLTTPDDPAAAALAGISALLAQLAVDGRALELAIHGTTLITNALIERKGARTALVTTGGHRDVLEIAREMRYDIYDLLLVNPEPLVPRPLRLELSARVDGLGREVRPVDAAELAALSEQLRTLDVAAVGVCLLHAYRNPEHEYQVGAALSAALPGVALTLSAEVAPEIREYERMSTTVANAYVQPLAASYLLRMEQQLHALGYTRPLYLMLSSGGTTSAETAARFPIRLVESGPAAGALAACFYGTQIGETDLVSFDMGGTTAKMCVILDGAPLMSHTFEIARVHRFKRGSGLPVRVPTIELLEIGAGGGSIARVDQLGLLKVGPQSAGAQPGPACYGQGGTAPTVTDANLLLGYLNPDYFLGGRMRLDLAAATAAFAPLAKALGLSIESAAYGVHRVVNEAMISATRVHIAERGADPRRLMLLAFGGAGPAHADAIARALKMRGYVIPANAGVASALGFLTAPVAFDLARTFTGIVDGSQLQALDAVFAELAAQGAATLAEAGVLPEAMRFVPSLDLRHLGQGHEVTVDLPEGELAALGLPTLRELFFARYAALYGYAQRHLELEVTTCRLRATGPRPELRLSAAQPVVERGAPEPKQRRPVFVAVWGRSAAVPVYERSSLAAGITLRGPAIIEEPESTAVIGPDARVYVDPQLNLIVQL